MGYAEEVTSSQQDPPLAPSGLRPELLPGLLWHWQAEGLLSARQVRAILIHEGMEDGAPQPRAVSPWAVTVSALGALVVGLGVIALVGANWSSIPGWGKLLGVLLPMLGAYAGGYTLRDRPGASLPGLGAALYLLGGVLYGALLALVSQGFQLDVSVESLLVLWGLGLLALAYAVRLPPALHLALPLGAVIPLSGLYGGWGGHAEGAIGGAGLLMLAAVPLHTRLGSEPGRRRLADPWAFWGAPLLLGSVYTLHLERSQTFTLWLALLIVLALGLTWLGQREDRRAWVNWGLLTVGVSILTVYFGLLGTLAVTGAALVGAGTLLLVLGWGLERARRRLTPGSTGSRRGRP